jgi:hypothetical protein
MHSGDILLNSKGNIFIESTQIWSFLRRSGRGYWSRRAVALWRPRLTKIVFKGLSNYSYDMAVKAARREASEVNKKGYSQGNI